ncbi:MAG TPA: hypothetical protein VIX18_12020 [Nitrospirota bacterium]
MEELRETKRQPIEVHRDCCMGVIGFKELSWKDHVATIVDINKQGVGIELGTRVEPGFVWFKDRVWGHRGGLLLWSNQAGERYRAGIKFLALSAEEERTVQNQIGQPGIHQSLVNPEKIVSSLIESLKKEAH